MCKRRNFSGAVTNISFSSFLFLLLLFLSYPYHLLFNKCLLLHNSKLSRKTRYATNIPTLKIFMTLTNYDLQPILLFSNSTNTFFYCLHILIKNIEIKNKIHLILFFIIPVYVTLYFCVMGLSVDFLTLFFHCFISERTMSKKINNI